MLFVERIAVPLLLLCQRLVLALLQLLQHRERHVRRGILQLRLMLPFKIGTFLGLPVDHLFPLLLPRLFGGRVPLSRL